MEKKYLITKKVKVQNLFSQEEDTNLWLQWFIGFMDADGSFQIFPKKGLILL